MLEGAALEVVYETDNFYVAMSSDVSAFLILDEIPNYFIYNRQTGKIEGMSNSLKAARSFLDYLETMDDEDELMAHISDTTVPPAPVSH
jgi:hypothetical protein